MSGVSPRWAYETLDRAHDLMAEVQREYLVAGSSVDAINLAKAIRIVTEILENHQEDWG